MSMENHRHIQFQNLADILVPSDRGVEGPIKDLVLHLSARALHRAIEHDLVIVGPETPQDYLDYLHGVTGFSPEILYAQSSEGPFRTVNQLAAVREYRKHNSSSEYALNPYMQSVQVARLSQEIGIPMAWVSAHQLLDESPNVVEQANNKAQFLREMKHLTGANLPNQCITQNDQEALEHLLSLRDRPGELGVFAQAASAGGGIGNLDLKFNGKTVVSKKIDLNSSRESDIKNAFGQWLVHMRHLGSQDFIISPLVDLVSSHTVSGFIPESGESIIYGIFEQTLHEENNDYQGFTWPAPNVNASSKHEMMRRTQAWMKHLQAKNFTGMTDVDFAEGYYQGEKIILHSESNTREDAYSFTLSHYARMLGWNPRNFAGINSDEIAIAAHDHVHLDYQNTFNLVKSLRYHGVPMLGIDSETNGLLIVTPPLKGQSAMAYFDKDPQTAKYHLFQVQRFLG